MIPTQKEAYARIQRAYIFATEEGNTILASTLRQMLLEYKARNINIERVELSHRPTQRPIYNPKTASIKLKRELYDTRIELDDEETVRQRYETYTQKRRVFQR